MNGSRRELGTQCMGYPWVRLEHAIQSVERATRVTLGAVALPRLMMIIWLLVTKCVDP